MIIFTDMSPYLKKSATDRLVAIELIFRKCFMATTKMIF